MMTSHENQQYRRKLKKCPVNQGFMSLSTFQLEYGRELARPRRQRRRRRRRRACALTSSTASHYNHEKINSWVSFSFLYGYGLRVEAWGGGGRRFSPINKDETVDDYLKTSWLFSLLARLNANVTS